MTPPRDSGQEPERGEGLPAAYWRVLPLHGITEVYGLEGLRHRLMLEFGEFPPDQQEVPSASPETTAPPPATDWPSSSPLTT